MRQQRKAASSDLATAEHAQPAPGTGSAYLMNIALGIAHH
jgi:hypothetical protein